MVEFQYDNRAMELIGSVIVQVIDGAPDYYAGEIESMRAKLDKQTEIISALAGLLSEEAQVRLVKQIAPYWKPVNA